MESVIVPPWLPILFHTTLLTGTPIPATTSPLSLAKHPAKPIGYEYLRLQNRQWGVWYLTASVWRLVHETETDWKKSKLFVDPSHPDFDSESVGDAIGELITEEWAPVEVTTFD